MRTEQTNPRLTIRHTDVMYIMCHVDKSPQEILKSPADTVFAF